MKQYAELKTLFDQANQGHVFQYWDELTSQQQEQFIAQLNGIDVNSIQQFIDLLDNPIDHADDLSSFDPPEIVFLPKTEDEIKNEKKALETGESAISQGKLGVFVVAGGQGSRLGFDGPKGSYPIGPVTERSLFQIFVEKILAANKKYQTNIPYYIMTSEANNKATIDFFKTHNYFGMDPKDIYFFTQKMLPALNEDRKLAMDRKDHLFMSPNGHGGSLLALYESGALDDMKKRGIELISYYQVDNPLIKIVDPRFVGYHLQKGSEASSKTAIKTDPMEKVGIFGMCDGRLRVIEYSDMPHDELHACLADGSLKYDAGSIAIHLFDVDFVYRLAGDGLKLPYHIAHKKIPYVNEAGEIIKPDSSNGYKFETFVFDALQYAEKTLILEIDRKEEFSPVKNATGKDSAVTCRQDMVNLYGKWLEAAGISVAKDSDGNVTQTIEISPLFANDSDNLKEKIDDTFQLDDPMVLGPKD